MLYLFISKFKFGDCRTVLFHIIHIFSYNSYFSEFCSRSLLSKYFMIVFMHFCRFGIYIVFFKNWTSIRPVGAEESDFFFFKGKEIRWLILYFFSYISQFGNGSFHYKTSSQHIYTILNCRWGLSLHPLPFISTKQYHPHFFILYLCVVLFLRSNILKEYDNM